MSRHLPSRANLDHLKKQAKDLLGDIQRAKPGWKLADGQHALTRWYGFGSWPNLKACVESQSQTGVPEDPNFGSSVPSQRREGAEDADPSAGYDANPNGNVDKGKALAGTWIANLSKSQQHPANPFRSATLKFTIIGDTVTIAQVFVDASGQEVGGRMTIHADGREHSTEYENGHGLIAQMAQHRHY